MSSDPTTMSPPRSHVPTDDSHASENGELDPGDQSTLKAIREARERWANGPVAKSTAKVPLRLPRFTTLSDLELPDVVTPADVSFQYMRDLGLPGEYPYTRGIQPTMYRGRLW